MWDINIDAREREQYSHNISVRTINCIQQSGVSVLVTISTYSGSVSANSTWMRISVPQYQYV